MAKAVDKQIEELKKQLKEQKATIGAETVLKGLRSGKIAAVYMAGNCSARVAGDVEKYAKLGGAKVEHLKVPNDELGVICKKPFSIMVLGIMR